MANSEPDLSVSRLQFHLSGHGSILSDFVCFMCCVSMQVFTRMVGVKLWLSMHNTTARAF